MSIQGAEYHRKYHADHLEKWREYNRKDYEKRREAIRMKRQTPEYKARMRDYLKGWRCRNVEKRRKAARDWHAAHPDWLRQYREAHGDLRRELYRQRKEAICARKRELAHTPKYRERIRRYSKARRANDTAYALKDVLRATINRAFRRQWIKKPFRTEALLGCTIAEAKAHIEVQFVNGMSWATRDSFHIDHWIPVAVFDLRDSEEVKWAFNWRNLRPLDPIENKRKSATLPTPLPAWLPAPIAERILARQSTTKTYAQTKT